MFAIKITGISVTVLSCFLFGFFKSRSFKMRYRKLILFCDGLDLLYEYVEQENCELITALKKAFKGCGFISFNGDCVLCRDGDLSKDDKAVIDAFFSLLGKSAKKIECDRIKSTKNALKKRAEEIFDEAPKKCKLWQTGGICIGLFIGILLI